MEVHVVCIVAKMLQLNLNTVVVERSNNILSNKI